MNPLECLTDSQANVSSEDELSDFGELLKKKAYGADSDGEPGDECEVQSRYSETSHEEGWQSQEFFDVEDSEDDEDGAFIDNNFLDCEGEEVLYQGVGTPMSKDIKRSLRDKVEKFREAFSAG